MSKASSFRRAACWNCSFLAAIHSLLTGVPHIGWADELDRWHWRNPQPNSMGFVGMTFGHSRFIAVGDGGWILSSTNQQQWSTTYCGLPVTFRNVLATDAGFLAFGISETNGVFLKSAEGTHWAAETAPEAVWMADAAFDHGQYVGVGYLHSFDKGPSLATSRDGLRWTPIDLSSFPNRNLNAIAYGTDRWVAVGDRGLILTSTDGEEWSLTESGAMHDLKDVAFSAGQFVAVGHQARTSVVLVSPDGLEWTTTLTRDGGTPTSSSDLDLDHVAAGATGFVAMGAGTVAMFSPDGQTWTEHPLGQPIIRGGVAYGNGYWATGGLTVTPTTALTTALWTSADGRAWTDRTGGVSSATQNGIAFGNGVYVSVGTRGQIARSTNGVDWSLVGSLGPSTDLVRVIHAGGQFLALGSQGNNALLLVSADGQQWTNRAPTLAARLLGAAHGKGLSVVVSGSRVLLSTNGNDWNLSSSTSASNLFDVVYDGGQFVAAGSKGTIQTSADGVDWTTHPTPTNASLRSIAFGGSTYVAVGTSTVLVSTNAVDWRVAHTGDYSLQSVAHGGGWFVAAGIGTGLFASDVLLTSSDGRTWSQRNIGGNLAPRCLAFDGRSFLLGGAGGAILQSDPVIAATPLFLSIRRTSEIELLLTGEAGRSYSIEGTIDLGTAPLWVRITNLLADSTTMRIPALPPANGPRQFYRARLEPQ